MEKRNIGIIVLVAILAVLALVFVNMRGSLAQPPAGANGAQSLAGTQWQLEEMRLDGQTVDLGSAEIDLQFTTDGQINGNGGCNGYFAGYEAAAGGSLSFGPVGATKMYCDATMQQETAYFQALEQIDRFSLENGRLVLTGGEQTALTFTQAAK